MLKLFLLKRMVLNASKNYCRKYTINMLCFCQYYSLFHGFFFYRLDPRVSFLRFNFVNLEFSDIQGLERLKKQDGKFLTIALCNSSRLHCLANSKRSMIFICFLIISGSNPRRVQGPSPRSLTKILMHFFMRKGAKK